MDLDQAQQCLYVGIFFHAFVVSKVGFVSQI